MSISICCCPPTIPAPDSTTSPIFCSCPRRSSSSICPRLRSSAAVAVGDQSLPPLVDTYRMSSSSTRNIQAEGAPFGTRGGTVIRTFLPLDGEYRIHVELADAPREPHQLEVTVDDERVRLISAELQTPPATAEAETAAKDAAPPDAQTVAEKLDEIAHRDQDQLGRQPPVRARSPERGPQKGARERLRRRCADEGRPARDRRHVPQAHVRQRRSAHSTAAARERAAAGDCERHDPWSAERFRDSGDTPSRRKIFVCTPASAAEDRGARRRFSRLWRVAPIDGPSPTPIFSRCWRIYDADRSEGGFDAGIEQALERILVSPQFLFRIEREPAKVAPGAVYRISDLELASRLSFFLWSSIPDDELLDRGRAREAEGPGGARAAGAADACAIPRSRALATNFAAQWLYLRDVEAKTPSPRLFPDFDLSLREDFERETELFLESVFSEDRSVLDLLQRELHVHQRTAGEALRDSERVRDRLPARHVSPTTVRDGLGCSGTAAS